MSYSSKSLHISLAVARIHCNTDHFTSSTSRAKKQTANTKLYSLKYTSEMPSLGLEYSQCDAEERGVAECVCVSV